MEMENKMPPCPVCGDDKASISARDFGRFRDVRCRRCGSYTITEKTQTLQLESIKDSRLCMYLSHKIRQMQGRSEPPVLSSEVIQALLANVSLPRPREQADNLIRWLGNRLNQADPAGWEKIGWPEGASLIGALSKDGFYRIRNQLIQEDRLLEIEQVDKEKITLTFAGWERYEELMRGHSDERIAFMAMPFGKPELDKLYFEWVKPAVSETGYDLRRVDENPKAGSIDERMLVEIRRSRFVIAEESDRNWNVSWEAGFADGLGKPVFYLCEESKFNDGKGMFDTSHHHTVQWTQGNLAGAMEELKATIRNTLPTEAKMADE